MNQPFYQKIKSVRQTFCLFQEVPLDAIKEQDADYTSRSGSRYYYTKEGLYRLSDHWGRAANSKWYMKSAAKGTEKTRLGFAKWGSFHKDNAYEKLYFIEYDSLLNTVSFNHKNNLTENQKAILLTSEAVTRKIQKIRQLLKNDHWTKYYNDPEIKHKLITTFIATDIAIDALKKKCMAQQ